MENRKGTRLLTINLYPFGRYTCKLCQIRPMYTLGYFTKSANFRPLIFFFHSFLKSATLEFFGRKKQPFGNSDLFFPDIINYLAPLAAILSASLLLWYCVIPVTGWKYLFIPPPGTYFSLESFLQCALYLFLGRFVYEHPVFDIFLYDTSSLFLSREVYLSSPC